MPEELANPHAQGPGSVGGPVPQGQPSPPQGGTPAPMGQPDSAAAQGAASPRQEVNSWLQPMSPADQAKIEEAANNPWLRREEEAQPSGYQTITPRMRKAPDGSVEILGNSGKWEPMSDTDKALVGTLHAAMGKFHEWGLRAKEDLPRFAGAVLGGIGGEFIPIPGSTIAGSGIGQVAGGIASNMIQGQPVTMKGMAKDFAGGAAAAAVPMGMGKFLAGQATQYGGEAAISPLVAKGAGILVQRMYDEQKAAQVLGISAGPSKTASELATVSARGPEAQKLYQMNLAKVAEIQEARDKAVAAWKGPYEVESGEAPDFHKILGDVMDNAGRDIGKYKALAQEVAGNQLYEMDPVMAGMRDKIKSLLPKGASVFNEQGRIDARLLSETTDRYGKLPRSVNELLQTYTQFDNAAKVGANMTVPGELKLATDSDKLMEPTARQSESTIVQGDDVAKPKVKPGFTLDEMEYYRKNLEDKAFNSGTRDEVSKLYAGLHHDLRSHMDAKMIDALSEKHPAEAATLMAQKDYYSRFKETAEDLQNKVKNDPTNAARTLIQGQNPQQVKDLWSLLTDKEQSYLRGAHLESLTDPLFDEATGRMKVASVDTAWRKIDPKVKEVVYGDEGTKQVNSIINLAKSVDNKAAPGYNPENDPMMSKLLGVIHLNHPEGALKFISNLLSRNRKAREFVVGQSKDILMPTGEDMASTARKQIFMQQAAQATLSRPVTTAAQALSAHLLTPSQAQPQSQQQH